MKLTYECIVSVFTEKELGKMLEDLGLNHHYTEKISLDKILQIDKKTITDGPAKCLSDLPWCFLKKLKMVNVTARDFETISESEETESDLDDLMNFTNSSHTVNPLDIVTALFLCSDGFVQQEMALKMSLCQFAVPLLLPNCDKNQSTLMLWAMRDIVKKYRPSSQIESKGFVEDRIILAELPMISFVRLGECSLSKSKLLNMMLSNSQQYHDTFVHHDMKCGDSPKRISNGLAEITWYLPRGNESSDVFREPLSIVNLHGDIASLEREFSFLCQTSAAVFVFFDNLDPECKQLLNQNHKTEIFLVGNQQSNSFNLDALKKLATELKITKNIILKTKNKNNADFVRSLQKTVKQIIENPKIKMPIDQMTDVAHELGISVDEDCPECQTAKESADAITGQIQNIAEYKQKHLQLQGEIWKELTRLEKEHYRLRKLGSENIQEYKSNIQEEIKRLREKQNTQNISDPMTCFISGISKTEPERFYFLKWMRMNLDDQSRQKLSQLRMQYKKIRNDSQNKDAIRDIDKELSNSSLGTEHFFREMGQIYEASVLLPETDPSRRQLQNLPKICAELLLEGLPLELVDGDASNIPLTWVSDVLSHLHEMVSPNNRIAVVTVLGVQSTGKSTLLNTMFGVQFAVSSGRCTRGAFMLLIKLGEDVKGILNSDFIVIIDTEGLKSPELSKMDDSYEHDNELATLVVGLSDISIINISMENATEMKDILQIVVHAFLRMKEVGKKPMCQFVHQNVSDVSADEKNLRGRELLLEQLNEMTRAAAKMEKKENNKSFTDVMDYSPDTGNWYIPGLWSGNPPMAPVNAGYSETVYQLKRNIIQQLGKHEIPLNDILKFKDWMKSLWEAVKHENFIFSFRNSLVAEAYMQLCIEFNKWEWEFKESTYNWVTYAETTISNFDTIASKSTIRNLNDLVLTLKTEARTKLTTWTTQILEKLKTYFENKEANVHLVERYKVDFENSAKNLQKNTESSVIRQLIVAKEIKEGLAEVDKIKENHTKEIEKAVCDLIDKCRQRRVQMSDETLEEEFNKMWEESVKKLSFCQQTPMDVFNNVLLFLMKDLSPKGSHACQLLDRVKLSECGEGPYQYEVKGMIKNIQQYASRYIPVQNLKLLGQTLADRVIDECDQYVEEKVEKCKNYSEVYIQELLRIIDDRLQKNYHVEVDTDFEVSLKQHICGRAARHFQQMHEQFLRENDPHVCLNNHKDK